MQDIKKQVDISGNYFLTTSSLDNIESNICITNGWPTRFSVVSVISTDNNCRICHGTTDERELFSYCECKGSVGLTHSSCLLLWIKKSGSVACEICKKDYSMITQLNKSIWKWKFTPISFKGYMKIFFFFSFLSLFSIFTTWAIWTTIDSRETTEEDHRMSYKWVSYIICDICLLVPVVGIIIVDYRSFFKYMSKCILINQTITLLPKDSPDVKDEMKPDLRKENLQTESQNVTCIHNVMKSNGEKQKSTVINVV